MCQEMMFQLFMLFRRENIGKIIRNKKKIYNNFKYNNN